MDRRGLFRRTFEAGAPLVAFFAQSYYQSEVQGTGMRGWEFKSPQQKIRAIETGKLPTHLDKDYELALATAQLAAVQIPRPFTPEVIAQNTSVIDADTIVGLLGDYLPKDSVESYRQLKSETVLYSTIAEEAPDRIRINRLALDNLTQSFSASLEHDISRRFQFRGLDIHTVIEKSALFRALALQAQSRQETIITPIISPAITMTRMAGFNFEEEKNTEGNFAQFTSPSEVMADVSGGIISQLVSAGNYIIHDNYAFGAEMISYLNERADISGEDFLDYYTGRRSTPELLHRWGDRTGTVHLPWIPDRIATPIEIGTTALYVVGSNADLSSPIGDQELVNSFRYLGLLSK